MTTLARAPAGQDDGRTEDAKRLWAAADLDGELPRGWWPRYLADPVHRGSCLSAVLAQGLVVLYGLASAVAVLARSRAGRAGP